MKIFKTSDRKKNFTAIKKSVTSLLGVLILMIGCADSKQDSLPADAPNILMIMSDNQYVKHQGNYGNTVVQTPTIDKIAESGVQFTHAFASPSCTPARSALLTGQNIWRLGEAGNLWSKFPDTLTTYVELIEEAGYTVGHAGKGWGPGHGDEIGGVETYGQGERMQNPAGENFENFGVFLDQQSTDKPWHFWISSRNPHRPTTIGSGIEAGMDLNDIVVPPYLPDVPEVRSDIADYYLQIQEFDREVAEILSLLDGSGFKENTIIIIVSDNGWQMPRGLANLYDFGTHIPLVISWPKRFKPNRTVDDMVRLKDLAPTFLELANVPIPEEYTARSLLPILESELEGRIEEDRSAVYIGRERHALGREGGVGYPMRSIRTYDYLYIQNMEADRWPAGDPPLFADIDAHMLHYESPTKEYMMLHKDDPEVRPLYEMAFMKRPEVELYDLNEDPYQMNNVADDPEYQQIREELHERLFTYLRNTNDPRVTGGEIVWDDQRYYLDSDWIGRPSEEAQEKFGLEEEYHYR